MLSQGLSYFLRCNVSALTSLDAMFLRDGAMIDFAAESDSAFTKHHVLPCFQRNLCRSIHDSAGVAYRNPALHR